VEFTDCGRIVGKPENYPNLTALTTECADSCRNIPWLMKKEPKQ
jgi:hypothetical protein